jgi:predicted ATPase
MPKFDISNDRKIIGRDFDILRVEMALLKRPDETQVNTMQALYLYGMSGVGKAAFLKYLCALWKNTSFVDAAIYIDFETRHLQSVDDFVLEIIAQLPPAKPQFRLAIRSLPGKDIRRLGH